MNAVATLALLLALAGCGSSQQDRQAPEADRDGVFVPQTYGEGDRVVLPLVFPDGTEAELLYPPELDLAGLGVTPYSSGSLHSKERVVGRDFVVFHGDLRQALAAYEETMEDNLGFQFGRWAVLVYDPTSGGMTAAERNAWVTNFHGKEDKSGFLLLDGTGPLRLARAGEHAGPELIFANSAQRDVSLFPGRCTPHRSRDEAVAGRCVDRSPGFADWCLSPGMTVHATGSEAFITALLRDLEIRDVRLAVPRAE